MSLENFVKWIEGVTKILPLIEMLVVFIENLFRRFGLRKSGELKKSTVLKMLDTMTEIPSDVLSPIIDSIVDIKNNQKEFTHDNGINKSDNTTGHA